MENTLIPEVFLDFSSFSEAVNTPSCGENQKERKVKENLWNQRTWETKLRHIEFAFDQIVIS